MTQDRRDDVGGKVAISILTAIVMLLISLFINAAWTLANEGSKKANEAVERITSMEARFSAFQSDLSEIKDLLRRKIPGT